MHLAAPQKSLYNSPPDGRGGSGARDLSRLSHNALTCQLILHDTLDPAAIRAATGGEQTNSTMADPRRREFLKLALGGAIAAAGAGRTGAEPLASPTPFSADVVLKQAAQLASQPFKAPSAPLPSVFSGLTFDQYAAIRRVPGTAIWSGEKVGFSLEPLHRGSVFTTPVAINIVENGLSQRVIYDPADFDFGKVQPPPAMGDLGFSGLRVLRASDDGFQDAAIFQGASFYRSRARGQNFGVTARGLAIRTGDEPGEEFPLFREFWVERPAPASNTLTMYALLDSESVTGSFRFTIRPLEATIIDTEMTLIARAATDKLGIGAMAANSLFSPLDHRRTDDWRAAVYEVTGLQVLSGKGEWLWRPLSNRETLQISAFADVNPHGFGLLQRSRSFDAFYDDVGRWELRPTLWIEPIDEWGEGDVRLLEIPAASETNANIVAQWRPKMSIAAGATQAFAYRQFWCWTPPSKPPLAVCTSSRGGKFGGHPRFAVEMTGDLFADPRKAAAASADIQANPGKLGSVRLFPYKDRRSVRVVFDVDPGSETYSELRLALKIDDQAVSETWLYRWTP